MKSSGWTYEQQQVIDEKLENSKLTEQLNAYKSKTDQIIESGLLSRKGNMDVVRNIVDRIHKNVHTKTPMTGPHGQEREGMLFMDDVLSLLQYATIVAKIDNEIHTAKRLESC